MPTFSVLLPSRNRLDLLKLAIRSVLEQDSDDFEIVVSDNASTDDYAAYVASLRDDRIKYLRSETALSVTDNWNKALAAASGTYVLMLGDDDALTPGLLRYLNAAIKGYCSPQVIYMKAYHYLYPDVDPGQPKGSLLDVTNSELFVRNREPYFLEKKEAEHLARRATSFHHEISFNAQHFLWRRDFTKCAEMFFRAPYPDYFACFYTFAKANAILVIPYPLVIIGIARQSFGFYVINDREEEGDAAFINSDSKIVSQVESEDIVKALQCSCSLHYRNWLLAAYRFKREIDLSYTIDVDLYRKIQIVERIAQMLMRDKTAELGPRDIVDEGRIEDAEFTFRIYNKIRKSTYDKKKNKISSINYAKYRILIGELNIYYATSSTDVSPTLHRNIIDAFNHIGGMPRDYIAKANSFLPLATGRPAERNQLTVVYLARRAEGIAPVKAFARSYRSLPAGIDHDLVVICKGADDVYIEAVKRVLGKDDAVYLKRSDAGVDIHAYLDAARQIETPWACFLNTFSVIRKSHWLAKMFAAANLAAVGMVGATGSYESLGLSLRSHRWFVEKLASGEPIEPETRRLFYWLEKITDRDLSRGSLFEKFMRSMLKNRHEIWLASQRLHRANIVKLYDRIIADLSDIPEFPNPHIRTNGFMVRPDFLRTNFPEMGVDKLDALRFESGRDGLTRKVLDCGLEVRIVGDGGSYDIPDWPDSQTFRSSNKEQLLLDDNQTAFFESLSDASKELYRYLTWGDRAVAPEKFAYIIPEGLKWSEYGLGT